MEARWFFREMSRGEMNTDPVEGEFFSTEHLESLSDALVRESIQNSLDATAGRVIHVAFGLNRSAPFTLKARYFEGLLPHLKAEQTGLSRIIAPDEPLSLLTVEDYGTRGLEGDVMQDSDLGLSSGGPKNDFFYFWRNVGRSGKELGDLGRWGLGKTVFQACSTVNTFFGVTLRASDKRAFLMGQSVLKTHRINGKKHYPYGWFGLFEGDFPMPVEDAGYIKDFCQDFGLNRLERPGLSVALPFPDDSINANDIIASSIIHYFFPILSGRLVVTVSDGERPVVIDKESIDGVAGKVVFSNSKRRRGDFKSLFGLARWAIAQQERAFVELKKARPGEKPEWTEDLFDSNVLAGLRDKFEMGERIAVRVPISIQREQGPVQDTSFDAFLERDYGLDRAEDRFIRDGITIAGVSSLRQKGVRVIVTASEREISSFLGDAENPAHTEWQERSPKFRGKYVFGATSLRFIKNCPRELVKILSRPSLGGPDFYLLSNIFSVEMPVEARPAKAPTGKSGEEEPYIPPMGEINITEGNLKLRPVEGGFRISALNHNKRVPRRVLVQAAYEIRQGNPFKKYKPLDFEMGKKPVAITPVKARIDPSLTMRNQTLFETEGPDFSVEITGFDTNRDLRVRVSFPEGIET